MNCVYSFFTKENLYSPGLLVDEVKCGGDCTCGGGHGERGRWAVASAPLVKMIGILNVLGVMRRG